MLWILPLMAFLLAAFAAPLPHTGVATGEMHLGSRIVAPPLANGVPLRIMPLGASITWGQATSDGNGYRGVLRDMLVATGNPVNMVGSQQHGTMVDNDNEGWPGYVIDQVYAKANTSVPAWRPNVILVNAGTNDCSQDRDVDHAGERMLAMLEQLFVLSPRTTVLLSSLIVNKNATTQRRVVTVNAQYRTVAVELKAKGRRLVYVEMQNEDGPQKGDMSDNTHPNDNGYRKMAILWYNALVEASKARLLEAPESVEGLPDDGGDVREKQHHNEIPVERNCTPASSNGSSTTRNAFSRSSLSRSDRWVVRTGSLNIILDVTFAAGDEPAIVEKLCQAWLKLRYHQPFLTAHLNIEEDKFVYTTPTDNALQQWLSDSFFIQHEPATVDNFLLHGAWAEFSSLHYFPSSSQILMRTHHWLIDGVGGLYLANCFLELFADVGPVPLFGDEARLLPPCLLDAAGFRDGGESAVEQATGKFMEFVQNLPSIGLPVELSPTGPGGTKRHWLAFPQKKLDALLAACRRKGLTLASVVHAAVVVATQEKAAKSELAKNFTTLALFDYRKYLPEPYCDVRQYPMGTWMLAPPFSLPPADFATQAEACRSVYKQPVARDVFPMLDSYETYAGMMADAFNVPPPPDAPMPSQPQLSSIGLVDGKIQLSYGSGENLVIVRKVEPVLDIMVATPLVFQWSFGGRSYINMCYNEKWQTDEFIKGFLERVAEVLMGNMGLS